VVGAWWGRSAEQGGQIQPPTSPRENIDVRVGPGNPEQVEWTHLLQRLHWTEVRPTSREKTEQGYMGFVGKTGVGPGLGWRLPLASRRRSIRRQVRVVSGLGSDRKGTKESPSYCDRSVDGYTKK